MSLIDMTTLERVKALPGNGGKASTEDDELIGRFITLVSARAAHEMGRCVYGEYYIKLEKYTEYRHVETRGQNIFYLNAYPITVKPTVYYSADSPREWTNEIDDDLVIYDMSRGIVYIEGFDYPQNFMALRFDYTGGMGADVDEFIEAYPELSAAIDIQVWFEYQRRLTSGLLSASAGGASVSYRDIVWLPEVLNVVRSFKRALP